MGNRSDPACLVAAALVVCAVLAFRKASRRLGFSKHAVLLQDRDAAMRYYAQAAQRAAAEGRLLVVIGNPNHY